MGRKPIGDKAMTNAERAAAHRRKRSAGRERLRADLTEIARLGVDMRSDFSRSAMQSKIAREALKYV